MNKELCFLIKGNALFLDKVLIAFNDTPIFFVCRDSNNLIYISLCTNIESLEYIIVKTTIQSMYEMLTQKIEMRTPFLEADHFWLVKTGASIDEDEVLYLDNQKMDFDALPYPNAKYQPINDDDIAYIDKIQSSYFNEIGFIAFNPIITDDELPNCALRFPENYTQSISPNFEFRSTSEGSFSKVRKTFECNPSKENRELFYTEQMEQQSKTVISSSFKEKILINSMTSLLEAA